MRKDVLEVVLEGRAWQQDVEAFSDSTGGVVAVLTSEPSPLRARCPVCLASGASADSSPDLSCFSPRSLPPTDATPLTCKAGMPCVLLPLPDGLGAVMVSGYVASDGERKELLARLMLRGLPEKQARAVARATPIMRREAACALARLAYSHLTALIDCIACDTDGPGPEFELLYEIGCGFEEHLGESEELPGMVLDRAMRLVSAEAGVLFVAEGDMLRPAASRSADLLGDPGPVRVGEGRVGAAALRTLAEITPHREPDGTRATSVLLPLRAGDELVGVLELHAAGGVEPVGSADVELLGLFASSASHALANARRYTEANSRVLELMQLNELSKALSADAELDRIVYLVTSVLDKVLEFEVGGLLLFGREEPARVVLRSDVSESSLMELLGEVTGTELPDGFLRRCAIVQNPGCIVAPGNRESVWNVIAIDVSTSQPEAGYLFVASRDAQAFTADDARLVRAQAAHASVALEKARTYHKLRSDVEKLVNTLSAMADAAERTTNGHAGRVMDYALTIGEEMDLPRDQLETLRFAGLLHDIGKLGVSQEIILKPARLTPEEMAEVKRHAEIGANIVDQMEFLDSVAPIVLHHHERWDGEGYPKGLAGEAIPLAARILAVADSFDAMTSERAYSKALPIGSARVELERGSGTQFDPQVVSAFLAILDRRAAQAATGIYAGGDEARSYLPA